MNPQLEAGLAAFERLADPGPYDIAWMHHHPGDRRGTHVVFGVLVHGNEYGSLPAAIRLIEALNSGRIRWSGPVSIFVGNPDAGRAERRFLDFDLNRAWVFDGHAERSGREIDRARELKPLLDDAGLFLDFHQTLLETRSAFWTFPWNPEFGHWARILACAPVGITRPPNQAFATPGLKCIDEYVRDRGRLGFTVELGHKGFDPEQEERCFRAMVRLLEVQERIDQGQTTLAHEAANGTPVTWFQTVHKEDHGPAERRLRPGLRSWTPVEAGEALQAPGSPEITSPVDGVLLFPKYPAPSEPLPAHLFHVGQALDGHPSELWG